MTILIIDDEADIREILAFNLSAAGYKVLQAQSAEQALELIGSGDSIDLLLLDVMLPGMSGFKLADTLRKEHTCELPIIFLTAKGSENDLLTGFCAGGDDYIPKPFSINEVLARIKAVLKRSRGAGSPSTISIEGLSIDTVNKTASIDGTLVPLSRKEYDILELLSSNRGKTFARKDIIAELWKDAPYVLERTVDVHITHLRSKLGKYREFICNRPGFGYYWTTSPKN